MWRDIKRIIDEHDNFLLTTHINPDGDGIGSASALIELLKMMEKEVRFAIREGGRTVGAGVVSEIIE